MCVAGCPTWHVLGQLGTVLKATVSISAGWSTCRPRAPLLACFAGYWQLWSLSLGVSPATAPRNESAAARCRAFPSLYAPNVS